MPEPSGQQATNVGWIKDPASALFGVIVVGALVAGAAFEASAELQTWAPPCLFRSVFGFPCPTCGTTRVFVMLANFDVVTALWFAPLPTLLAATGLFLGIWALARQLGVMQASPDDALANLLDQRKAIFFFVVVVALSWAVSILRLRAGLDL